MLSFSTNPDFNYWKMDTNVVIIGAGIAGLAAGYQLKKAGCDSIILEALSFVGGR
ncbi:MAG: NAD(P)-binding protein, partial [Syntrophobacteria bacterium]